MSTITDNNSIIEQGPDPRAAADGGSMGSRPSQAIFLGNLALALLGFMLVATAFVLASATIAG